MDLVLTEHRRVETIYFLMSEDNPALQLKLPWIKIGTDSVGLNPEGAKDLTHPRSYGTFPKVLGEFVREKKIRPVVSRVIKGLDNLDGINDLFEDMKEGKQFGKLVIEITSSNSGSSSKI